MTGSCKERAEWTSLSELVHEIIGGAVRRHTFTQWDLELLFDLQNCRVKKSCRPELLRRYVRAVQQHFAGGATRPLRLSAFIERESAARVARSTPMTIKPISIKPSSIKPAVEVLAAPLPRP